MHFNTRFVTIIALVILSVLGGLLGRQFDADVGFVVGTLSTYLLLCGLLIVMGKVTFKP